MKDEKKKAKPKRLVDMRKFTGKRCPDCFCSSCQCREISQIERRDPKYLEEF